MKSEAVVGEKPSPESLANLLGLKVLRYGPNEPCGSHIPDRIDSGFDIAYTPADQTIHVSVGEWEFTSILHEVAHWLCATSAERKILNWGFDSDSPPPDKTENKACDINIGLCALLGELNDAKECARYLCTDLSDGSALLLRWKAYALLRYSGVDISHNGLLLSL